MMIDFEEKLIVCINTHKNRAKFCRTWGVGYQTVKDWLDGKRISNLGVAFIVAVHEIITLRRRVTALQATIRKAFQPVIITKRQEFFFTCPKCHCGDIPLMGKFCQGCGSPIKWID